MLLGERTIKGEHHQTSGQSSGYSGSKHLGLLTSHRPSTSAVSVLTLVLLCVFIYICILYMGTMDTYYEYLS